ncbi:Calmodulin [Diplonema papillatum]|nr:Calmodulin [Diplonema papillatum]
MQTLESVVRAEHRAERHTVREVPQCSGSHTCTFHLKGLAAHTDYFMKLSLGRQNSLLVSVAFAAAGNMAGTFMCTSRVTMYASFVELPSPIRYRHQVQLEKAGDDHSLEKNVFNWSKADGFVYFAAFSSSPLEWLTVTCTVGESVARSQDLCQIWKISSLQTPSAEDISLLRQWVWERHAELMVGEKDVFDENGQSPLHHNAACLGDVGTTSLLLKDYKRFVCPRRADNNLLTALHLLCMCRDLDEEKDKMRYRRAVKMLGLLLSDGECEVHVQDNQGNTPLHYACRMYCGGDVFLMMLLRAPSLNLGCCNRAGRTALEEYTERGDHVTTHGMNRLKDMFAEAEAAGVTYYVPQLHSHTPIMRDPVPPIRNTVSGDVLPPELVIKDSFGHGMPVGLDEDRLQAEFRKYDRDGSGFLSADEARRAFRNYESFGARMTDSEIDTLMRSVGVLSDGKVTVDEFAVLLLRLDSR